MDITEAIHSAQPLLQHSIEGVQGKRLLPRLLYLGSVTVEATSAGQMQLYRLLRNYPKDRLHIVEAECGVSRPGGRIPGVSYTELKPAFRRGWFFARNRLPKLFWWALNLHAAWQARRVARLMAPFRPEAILTIHDGFGWLTADKLSRRLEVPLHLILHDDWFRNLAMSTKVRTLFQTYFERVYRTATTRFCISPYMEKSYATKFGASGVVLYPIRNPALAGMASSLSASPAAARPLTVAYAGNVFSAGSWLSLKYVAQALQHIGGRLVLFGPMDAMECTNNGLTEENVTLAGFVKDVELIKALRDQADILFLPMTFEESERSNMELCFPSKLADYTAAGLPMIIYGPLYCSAVRWASENPGAAEVVTDEGLDRIAAALDRLADVRQRATLGACALKLGDAFFSSEIGCEIFNSALTLRTHEDGPGRSASKIPGQSSSVAV